MADYNAIHPSPFARRRYPVSLGITGGADYETMTGTVVGDRKPDPAERSRDYDRALRASQMVRSRFQSHGPPGASSMYQSGIGGMSMAQTAVLGDSQGSADTGRGRVPDVVSTLTGAAVSAGATTVELEADGGVESELGESYVDGVVKRPKPFGISQSQQEEEEELEDGGVLGLLAQIYGRKDHRPGI
jgi:autophagy-related protein 9